MQSLNSVVEDCVFIKCMGYFQMQYKHLVLSKQRHLLNILWWDYIITVKNSVKCIHGDHIPKIAYSWDTVITWEMQSNRSDELVHYYNPAFFWIDQHDSNGITLKEKSHLLQCDKQITRRMRIITTRAWAITFTKGNITEHLSHITAVIVYSLPII